MSVSAALRDAYLEQAKREQARRAASASRDGSPYAADPCRYAEEVLQVDWWYKQQEIARALLRPPYKVLVKASHKVGKTHLAGGLVNWWYDSFRPGVTITTAPSERQVRDLLWKEVRVQRRGRGGFAGPKAPRLESAPNHFAHGFVSKDGDSFQGMHSPHSFFIFDEAVGVNPIMWETAESMFNGEGHAWLAIFNPTDTSSQAYAEEQTGDWTVITLSSIDHPNIAAELAGLPPPFPSAIRLKRLDTLLRKWCRPVAGKPLSTDVEWPPQSGEYLRPGPVAEARLLGRWPSQATNNVWSDAAWTAAETAIIREPDEPIQIGCDVARFGDDFTAIHVRRGSVSLHHESVNGWSTVETAGRLKELAGIYGRRANQEPTAVLVAIDDDGVGGGVTDNKGEYNFQPVSGAETPNDADDYPNRRSELWFVVAERALDGRLSLARLDADSRREMRRQAMAPTWKLDAQGRRVVEPKDKTKERIKRSPDDIDAMNLAYSTPKSRKAKAVKRNIWT